jgi:hypothetical protein
MPHRIEIDDQVYAELERHVKGFEQPNDVLRRLLLRGEASVPPAVVSGRKGKLLPLLQAELIAAGDVLVHERKRKGDRFEATVTEQGWLDVRGRPYQSPSPALGDLVGSQIDGWHNWKHVKTVKTLRVLRNDAGL